MEVRLTLMDEVWRRRSTGEERRRACEGIRRSGVGGDGGKVRVAGSLPSSIIVPPCPARTYPSRAGCAPPASLCSCSYVRRLRGLASGVVHRLRRPPATCVGPPLARVTSQQKFNREITILSEKLRNDVCHRCRTRFSSFFVLCLRATRHLYLPSMRDDLWLEYPIPPLPDFTCPHQVSKA